MICPRSHSRARFSAKPMFFSLPWQKPSISPLKDQASLLSLSAWEGPGQEMEQSLAVFMKGMKAGVAEGLPSSGCAIPCQSLDLIRRGAQGQWLD